MKRTLALFAFGPAALLLGAVLTDSRARREDEGRARRRPRLRGLGAVDGGVRQGRRGKRRASEGGARAKKLELRLTGRISAVAKREVGVLGWRVVDAAP